MTALGRWSLFCIALLVLTPVWAEDAPKEKAEKKAGEKKEVKPDESKKEDSKDGEKTEKMDSAELEKLFSESLSGVALVGKFTVDGSDKDPNLDRYEIKTVTKLNGDVWLFSGIKYGKRELPLPLPLRVIWSGDTPVLTMDKVTIPGLGTFSCRLLFHGDRYAGTWQHDDHGGHMWGKIEKLEKAKPAE